MLLLGIFWVPANPAPEGSSLPIAAVGPPPRPLKGLSPLDLWLGSSLGN